MTANRPDPPDSNSKEMNFPMELEQLEDSDLSAAGNGAENAVAQGNQNGLVPLHSTPIKPNLDSKNTEISDLLIVDTNIVIKEGPKSAQDSGKDIVGEASKADPVPEHQVPTITSTEIETAVEIKDTNEIISREDSADKDDQQGTAATATTASTLSLTPSPEKDPDGSLRSWLILFAGFSGSMWSAGLSVSWGVFQRTLLTEDTFPGATNFQLSFVGTVIFGVSVIAIFFVGPMTDLFPPASLALAGAVCCATSMLSMSFATALWQMYLASALYGIGGSLVYTPGTVMVNTWFTRRRPFAMGILAAGTGVASFIMNPIAQACISARDWRFALRILALMCICWMGPTALLLKRRLKPVKRKGSFITFVYFKNITFSLLFASVLSIMFVFFFPPIYIPLLLFDGGYSNATGAAAVSVFSAVMAIGRVIGGAMAMKAGELNMFVLACFFPFIMTLIWMSNPSNLPTTIVCSVFWAFFCGAPLVTMPLIAASEFGLEKLGSVMGVLWLSFFPGELFGPSLIGVIIDKNTPYVDGTRQPANYVPALGFVAAMWFVGGFLISVLRWKKVGWKVLTKI